MPFETFTKRMVPLTKSPFVTIQRKGTFSMNKSAWVMLGEPEAIEFLYDKDEKVVGLRAVEATKEHAYPVRGVKTQEGPWIASGIAFTKYYGIDTGQSRRYPVTLDNNILCIDLKTGGTVVTSNRSRAADEASTADGESSPGVSQPV